FCSIQLSSLCNSPPPQSADYLRRSTLDTLDASTNALALSGRFHRAKVEHYLHRAEDFAQMARYNAALKTLETVFSLDPENSAGKSLKKRVQYCLTSLLELSRDYQPCDSSKDSGRQRRRLVMIIDQDERILISLTESLRKYGLEAIAASSYKEAVDTITKIKPDLVISEVNFADGPAGFDLFLWVRTNTSTQVIPFLFLATRIDRDTLIAGKRLGVDDFILKPFDVDVVTSFIRNCLFRQKNDQTR
ncbi:MAG: response regulator, partial [Ignavibacteria bacterium]|nr:response regulator [Ignavibacteria bacterium]